MRIAFCEEKQALLEREREKREIHVLLCLASASHRSIACLHQQLMCVCVHVSKGTVHGHVHRLIALKLHIVIPVLQNYSKLTSIKVRFRLRQKKSRTGMTPSVPQKCHTNQTA
jgi:hypothetical protein